MQPAIILLAAITTSLSAEPDRPAELRAARYVADSAEAAYPGQIERIDVSLSADAEAGQRLVVRFSSKEGSFAFAAIGRGAPSLLTKDRRVDLDRYLLQTGAGKLLEFRRRETGKPFLPFSFELQPDHFLPVCLDEAGVFCKETMLLGETFSRAEAPPDAAAWPPSDAKVIELSDDLLIGTSRNFRNVEPRIPQRKFAKDSNLDYTYRPLDEADLRRMLAAGFNYFDRVLPGQWEYLIDKPCFFDLNTLQREARPLFPEVFYHPGFQGVEDFLDEPAFIFLQDTMHEDFAGMNPAKDLAAMARRQEQATQDEFDRKRRGRIDGLEKKLDEAGIELPGVELVEPPFPIWEEFYSTGCYQLRSPVSGFVHEGRYRHPETVKLLNNTFRTWLPKRPETMFQFYFAFLRGAARVFDKDWGMAIYGQADSDVSLLGITMAYDRGARYLWFWSSDRDHHLPFEEQLALAEGLSAHIRDHPRGPRRELVRGADDAIVLPYGFTFSVSDWQKRRMANLWQRPSFPLEGGRTADGTPYYSVLRCAAEEMERLIGDGREFDIVIDVPELASAGYPRLHDVLPEARQQAYEYPWWIHYKLQFALVVLVAILLAIWTYRLVRWIRRRFLAPRPAAE